MQCLQALVGDGGKYQLGLLMVLFVTAASATASVNRADNKAQEGNSHGDDEDGERVSGGCACFCTPGLGI